MLDFAKSWLSGINAPAGNGRAPLRLLVLSGCMVIMAGCSSVPDAANPVEWYKDVRNAVVGDDKATDKAGEKPANELVADRDKPAPGADEPFPKLSSVPQKPKTSTAADRQKISEGLVADRESARRYSDEVIRRQGDASNPLPPPTQAPAPAPVPQPVVTPPAPAKPMPQVMAKAEAKPAPASVPAPPKIASPPAPPSQIMVPPTAPSGPRLASVESLNASAGANGPATVVISGSGVHTSSNSSAAAVASGDLANVNLPGVRTLSDFDPANSRGSYQVATIVFEDGSSKLRGSDRRILQKVAAQHKKVGGTIRVVGHASHRTRTLDAVKHKIVNFEISAARAEAVAKQLVKFGARPNAMFVGAVSDNQPKYREHMPTGEAGNRRTEIFIDF